MKAAVTAKTTFFFKDCTFSKSVQNIYRYERQSRGQKIIFALTVQRFKNLLLFFQVNYKLEIRKKKGNTRRKLQTHRKKWLNKIIKFYLIVPMSQCLFQLFYSELTLFKREKMISSIFFSNHHSFSFLKNSHFLISFELLLLNTRQQTI